MDKCSSLSQDELRVYSLDAVLMNAEENFSKLWAAYLKSQSQSWKERNHANIYSLFFRPIFENPFLPNLFNTRKPKIQKAYIIAKLELAIAGLEVLPEWICQNVERYIPLVIDSSKNDPITFRYLLYLLLTEKYDKIQSYLASPKFNPILKAQFEAGICFFREDLDGAIRCFNEAEKLELEAKRKTHEFEPFFEVLHLFCMFASETPRWDWLEAVLDRAFGMGSSWTCLRETYYSTRNQREPDLFRLGREFESYPGIPLIFSTLMNTAARVWFWEADDAQMDAVRKRLSDIVQNTPSAFGWFARQARGIDENLDKLIYTNDKKGYEPTGFFSRIVVKREPWDMIRNAIRQMAEDENANPSAPEVEKDRRLTWRFEVGYYPNFELVPYEQVRKKADTWSSGRKIAMSRLFNDRSKLDFLTPQDLAVVDTIQMERSYGYGNDVYLFTLRSLLALANHPLVFDLKTGQTHMSITSSMPVLNVTDKKDRPCVQIQPYPDDFSGDANPYVYFQKSKDTSFTVYTFYPVHVAIMKFMQSKGVTVPRGREKEIQEVLEPILPKFRLNIDSKASQYISKAATVENVASDSRVHLFLEPVEDTLCVQLRAYPLGEDCEASAPAAGLETIFVQKDGQTLCALRDLDKERENLHRIFEASPTLAQTEKEDGRYTFETPDEAFQFLAELESLVTAYRAAEETPKKEKKSKAKKKSEVEDVPEDAPVVEKLSPDAPMVIHWPQGKRKRVSSVTSFKNLSLNLTSADTWFEARGNLQIDQEEVDLAQLLLAMTASESRFVEIRPNEFLALSSQLRKKLEELRASARIQGNHVKIHPLAAHVVEDAFAPVAAQVGKLRVSDTWKNNIERFRKADGLSVSVPRTLQGNLRDYQVDGFQWLSQLAAWGAGGCLADDMGLGKTIQAIAVLLSRAKLGPALVVAPTSVCANWEREIARFAPSLNSVRVASFVETGGRIDRSEIIQNTRAQDVILTNYAILQREAEAFAQQKFATIVLDEAQAIKNVQAERTQAVLQLQGDFRFVTTGTPIENNLGELWSLFEFINPGFLGSKSDFDRNFGTPIQKDGSAEAKSRLKRLVKPFILRRFKNDVLTELPPKTEIVLDVELDSQEMALYEAIRQKAVAQLQSMSGSKSGAQRIQILAELMKLRRACCHPTLALPDSPLPGAKLLALTATTQELLDNNHKILIFSQFVDYLQIIARHFDEVGISYQYLDGSMTQKKRQCAIDAFQTGEDGVFLISLKAGGTGLNLTAADYVIHADPWWNPAVENQASDRAHRIGQTRPVTIYRMITKDTIEEKIIELHQRKEQLAQDILGDADRPADVSLEELLQLLGTR